MKKLTLKDLKNAKVPQNRSFKAGLKEQLLSRAEKEYSSTPYTNPFMKTLLRFSVSFAVIALLLTQVVFPGNSESFSSFIQEAGAANEEHGDEIYYTVTVSESSSYFETENFTGWQTTSENHAETWIAPNGDIRQESSFTSFNGPIEDGSFEQVDQTDISMTVTDEYGNQITYTQLQETGTEIREINGVLSEEPTYNVHPGKQNTAEALQEKFLNQITCLNTQENSDFIGYSIFRMDERDSTFLEGIATAHPKDDTYNFIAKLDDAASGKLSSSQLIDFFEKVQNEENVSFELVEEDGHEEAVITFNMEDFMQVSSNSPEGLENYDRPDNKVIFVFDASTYRLKEMSSEISYDGRVTERSSLSVLSSEYLGYEENLSLFEPTEEFTALSLTDRFEQDSGNFEEGCYRQYEKLSTEEEAVWMETMYRLFDEGEEEFWNSPLKTNMQYYLLPGDNTVHEVK